MTTITTSYGGSAGPQVTFNYDEGGRLTFTSRTIGGSGTEVNTTFVYDSANRLVTSTNGSDVFNMYLDRWVDTPLATYVYHYDEAGRLTAETDAEGTASFTYDNANELTGVSGSRSESYTYDANGNRTDTGYSTGTGNEQTASPGTTYTYDNAGNLVSQTDTSTHVVTTYTYDFRNRLTEVTVGGTIVATYTYDALNRRIGIDDSGTQTWTVYDGTGADALPYADFNGSGSLTERYLSGVGVVNGAAVDQLLARTSSGGTTAWYLTDKLGSVRDIASSSGTELDHVVYDSFGNIVTETHASNGDRFKFAGMEYDATVGQYYDRARYYDEAIGRFMGQDPMGFDAGDANLYRYTGNGPTNATDPSGLMTVAILGVNVTPLPLSQSPFRIEQNLGPWYEVDVKGVIVVDGGLGRWSLVGKLPFTGAIFVSPDDSPLWLASKQPLFLIPTDKVIPHKTWKFDVSETVGDWFWNPNVVTLPFVFVTAQEASFTGLRARHASDLEPIPRPTILASSTPSPPTKPPISLA